MPDGSSAQEPEWWLPSRALVMQDEESGHPVPFILEFHAASNAQRKLHWVALKEVPSVIAKVGDFIGRRVKGSGGIWRAPSTAAHGGKAHTHVVHDGGDYIHEVRTLGRSE